MSSTSMAHVAKSTSSVPTDPFAPVKLPPHTQTPTTTTAASDAEAQEAPTPKRSDSLPAPLFRRASTETEHSAPQLSASSRSNSTSLSDLFSGARTARDSQHCIASVLYKNRATQALHQTKSSSPPGSGAQTPSDLNPEVAVLVKALSKEDQPTLANAANTIANLVLRKELQTQIIENLGPRMLDLVLQSGFRDVHRFVALAFCRLAQKADNVALLIGISDFYPALSELAGSPSGTIWRQAARTVALVTIHAEQPEPIVDIVGVASLKKLALADQLEFQSDALRALLRLSETRCAEAVVDGDFWQSLFKIASESSIPIIPQLACEVMSNACEQGFASLIVCDDSVEALNALCEKPNLAPGALRVARRLHDQLDGASVSRAPTKEATSPKRGVSPSVAKEAAAPVLEDCASNLVQ